jgi:hypothetical protein
MPTKRIALFNRPTFAEKMAYENRNPDMNDYMYRMVKGEWHINTVIAFEKHLKRLLMCDKVQPPVTDYANRL